MSGLEVAGAVAAIVASPFAAVAGVYAVKTYRRQGVDSAAATQRWLSRIQPRPQVVPHQLVGTTFQYSLLNAGGAALEWVAVWSFKGQVFLLKRPVGAQYQQAGEVFTVTSVGVLPGGVEDNDLFVSVAQDEHGGWWDCIRHEQIERDHKALMLGEAERRGVAALLPESWRNSIR